MHKHIIGENDYYTCDKCGEIFFVSALCEDHEQECEGVAMPCLYSVYAYLGGKEKPIATGVTKHKNGIAVSADKVTAFIEQGHKYLVYPGGGSVRSTIRSSMVMLEDIPAAVAAVQKLFLDKILEISRAIPDINTYVMSVMNAIKTLQK